MIKQVFFIVFDFAGGFGGEESREILRIFARLAKGRFWIKFP